MKQQLLNREIIRELYFNKLSSVTTLSHRLNKSIPVVLKALNELIEKGQVVETGFAPSTGGRRPIMYSLKPDSRYVVAVAMDQFITRLALLDMSNHIVGSQETENLPLSGNENALPALADAIESFIVRSGISKDEIVGVGIGMPGFIDVRKSLNYTFLKSGNRSIVNIIGEHLSLPVFIDNDSSVIALAELKFGSCTGRKNALVINIGWGIGLGMILNSDLFRGDTGFAGEFSHIPLFSNNKLCSCGKTGCLETETSLLVIIEKARTGLAAGRVSILKDRLSEAGIEEAFERIVTAAQQGDQFAIELISKAAYEIGRGISILIHLLNPEVIVLSGRGALAGKLWKGPIQQAIDEFSIPRLAAHTEIELSKLDYMAELIGAASLVMENYSRISTEQNKSAVKN